MLNDFMIEDHIKNALKEDVPFGDVTTQTLVKNDTVIKAKMNVRKDCVICGLEVAKKVFEILSKDAKVELCAKDGELQRIVPINKAAKINNFLVMRQYFRRGFFLFEQKGVVCAKQNKKFFAVIFQNNS